MHTVSGLTLVSHDASSCTGLLEVSKDIFGGLLAIKGLCRLSRPPIAAMKTFILSTLATQALGHAIFQQLWVDGVDKGTSCTRLPGTNYVSNSPVSVSK